MHLRKFSSVFGTIREIPHRRKCALATSQSIAVCDCPLGENARRRFDILSEPFRKGTMQTVREVSLAFLLGTVLSAQSPQANLSGIVSDAQGAVVVGATV